MMQTTDARALAHSFNSWGECRFDSTGVHSVHCDAVTDQVTSALASARNQALEEAAVVADREASRQFVSCEWLDCAVAIGDAVRALKSKE